MEAHPIPQNVTSFQFHLIGDMTLKQFGFLAAGLTIGYLNFVFLAPYFPILAWPMIIISVLLGVAFAFLPIQDRPLDHWVKAFLKAVYSPTKRSWTKNNLTTKDTVFASRLNLYLSNQKLAQNPSTAPTIVMRAAPIGPQPIPTAEALSQTVKLAREAHNLQQQVVQTQKDLAQIGHAAVAGAKPEAYTAHVNAVMDNLQRLVKETTNVQTKLAVSTGQQVTPPTVKVEVVAPAPRPKVQIILTSLPNVINGIVLDSEGNYLQDVVIVVKDKDNLPVRALKTNKLGQFTGATPLPNGTYTVEVEKDNFIFDLIKTELDGKVLPALNIAARKVMGNS